MKKIYEVHQLHRLDEGAIAAQGMTSHDLVETKARQFVYQFKKLFELPPQIIHIFAGHGANGAIALAVARALGESNYRVQVYLIYKQGTLDEECDYQRGRLEQSAAKVSLTEVSREFRMPVFARGEVIIDGLFGSELARTLEPSYVALIKRINASALPIVSIDMPSGIGAQYNTQEACQQAVRATYTLTFETPRLAMLCPENAPYIGQWYVLPLGIGAEVHGSIESRYHMVTDEGLGRLLIPRHRCTSKQSCGAALLIGGAQGLYGRLSLAAQAALRVGSGSVCVHAPLRVQGLLPLALPEVEVTEQDLPEQPRHLRRYTAIAVGTGLPAGILDEAYLRELSASYAHPLLLDDEAIDLLCLDAGLLASLPRYSILLCSKERQTNLFGEHDHTLDLIEDASALAVRHTLTVVLKGAYTTICSPDGRVYFSVTGSAGLATSGSGDVLTGLVLGLRARGYDDVAASLLGCYLHGRAAELYAVRESEESLLASDLIAYIGKALKELENR